MLLITSLCWSLCASGSTVWKPTDSNTNYLSLDAGQGISFALVDYDETTGTADLADKLLFESGDQISFFSRHGGYYARNNSDPVHPFLALGATKWFIVCATDGNGWFMDDDTPQKLGTYLYALNFLFPDSTHALIQVDAKPIFHVTTVPIPPAALLLSGGLAALLAAARSRTRRR